MGDSVLPEVADKGMSAHGWSSDPETDRELREKYGPSIHESCALKIRSYQVMTRHLAAVLKKWIPMAALEECVRVSGEAVCSKCRLPFREHLEVAPTFHIGCDGTVLKT
jgi:hypothetical protein